MSDRTRPSIALLAAPETSSSVLYGLYDVLLSVGAVYSDMTTGQPDESLLDLKIIASDDKPFRCFGNVLVEPHGTSTASRRSMSPSSATCTRRPIRRCVDAISARSPG
jgi:hypothetical protein